MKNTDTQHVSTKAKALITIRTYTEVSDIEISELIKPFIREKGISWANDLSVYWLVAYLDETVCGIVALAIKDGKGRCKSDVVLPEYRGLGIYQELSYARINLSFSLNCTQLTAFASNNSIKQFKKNNFIETGKGSTVAKYLTLNLTN